MRKLALSYAAKRLVAAAGGMLCAGTDCFLLGRVNIYRNRPYTINIDRELP